MHNSSQMSIPMSLFSQNKNKNKEIFCMCDGFLLLAKLVDIVFCNLHDHRKMKNKNENIFVILILGSTS